ncbi:hypothetical protein SteCoe_36784 [Stentor coeruleus]|uniref:Uncharacterized protein n=1 Tax=Stentor coeruleus TaxID=5963 RepID=A0A1R2APE6_9CILI|nr:hypothetical protein SteCoe_36784 [Stentor coeruleus]
MLKLISKDHTYCLSMFLLYSTIITMGAFELYLPWFSYCEGKFYLTQVFTNIRGIGLYGPWKSYSQSSEDICSSFNITIERTCAGYCNFVGNMDWVGKIAWSLTILCSVYNLVYCTLLILQRYYLISIKTPLVLCWFSVLVKISIGIIVFELSHVQNLRHSFIPDCDPHMDSGLHLYVLDVFASILVGYVTYNKDAIFRIGLSTPINI